MQLATCWLLLDKRGSNTPLRGVTPAELVLLVKDRTAFVGRCPIHNLVVVGESKRPMEVEKERLRQKYGKGLHDQTGKKVEADAYKIDALYPGIGAVLPSTFEEVNLPQTLDNNLSTPLPDEPEWTEERLRALDEPGEVETPVAV